ncbi:alpha/beta fold hydrolase [Nocardia mexicana]|uniref:Pimeloyl-ACP methyl ester carboxylesterase n=1 Tax=Nocardia mexicana TaxID=279262 RepID=A0A370GRK1_9NOCA|nr:alpha/beta fold hydrolase [Nocardia mexicana]RDI46342.1 pimeloyl-ACP methyl ester carboxylesterase [Nocardia mexicana]
MAKIGRFKNDAARAQYMQAYEKLSALWPLPSTEHHIETSFGSTHVRESGSGEGAPIVLLHPVGGTGSYWYASIEELARDRVVYAPDTIGTGGLSVQTAPLSEEADFATWLDEVLASLGVGRAHVVGYSHGAWHAALAALHAPSRLASLTLIEPGGVLVKPSWRVLLKILRIGLRPTEANMRKMRDWLTPGIEMSPDEEAYVNIAYKAYRMGVGWARPLEDEELQSITVPTLAIFGANSVVSEPESSVRRIRTNLAHNEIEIYPDRGHAVLDEIRGQVLQRIMDFIRKHESVSVD